MIILDILNNLLLAYHHCHHWRALAREHTILCIVGLQLTS